MTSTTSLITVFGATGNQGGPVARSLLKNPGFKVRALTRNPNSDASQKLALQGAEIQQADSFGLKSMVSVFAGSWGVFVNINSDDKVRNLVPRVRISWYSWLKDIQSIKESYLTEIDLGKIIVDAAAEAGVRHFLFSTAPNSFELSGGKAIEKSAQCKPPLDQYLVLLRRFR
jgi:nucleoside-diphosphate-sugar epimerase